MKKIIVIVIFLCYLLLSIPAPTLQASQFKAVKDYLPNVKPIVAHIKYSWHGKEQDSWRAGTAFALASTQKATYWITVAHVVKEGNDSRLLSTQIDGEHVKLICIKDHLALFKENPPRDVKDLRLAEGIKIGQTVVALAYPRLSNSQELTYTEGVLSTIIKDKESIRENGDILVTISGLRGASGGAVFVINEKGRAKLAAVLGTFYSGSPLTGAWLVPDNFLESCLNNEDI